MKNVEFSSQSGPKNVPYRYTLSNMTHLFLFLLPVTAGMMLLESCSSPSQSKIEEQFEAIEAYQKLAETILVEKKEEKLVYQEKGLMVYFNYPEKKEGDIRPGAGAVLYYVDSWDPEMQATPSQPSASEMEDLRMISKLDPDEYEDVERRSVIEGMEAGNKLKLYTVAVMYSGEMLNSVAGLSSGSGLTAFTEEMVYAYNWSEKAKDDVRVELRNLINSRDENESVSEHDFDSLPEIQAVESVSLSEMIFKNLYFSPYMDANPFSQRFDYGMTCELMFMPGKSKIYYNGPDQTLSYSFGMDF